ncbi:MAG: hypothetical protein N3B18_05470 [Desulfobacterota bacterium]|nr:hypothetical protein [Thermodesulfobacteriota bacterium]
MRRGAPLIDAIRRRPLLLKHLFIVCLGCIASTSLAVPDGAPAHDVVSSIPFGWSLFGLIGSCGLALACKAVARRFLERDSDYYER